MNNSLARAIAPERTLSSPYTTVPNQPTISQAIVLPGDWRYFPIIVGFVVIIFGTIGNGMTIFAYKRNKSLQTSFNILIANLCIVELVFAGLIVTLQLPGFMLQRNPYPTALCQIIGYLYYISMAASLQNLVAIAVNRYVGIVKTKVYQQLFTGRRLAICIASIWLLPPILYLPVVIGGAIGWQGSTLRCAMGKSKSGAINWYNTVLNILFQSISLVLLIVLYGCIMRKVRAVQRKVKRHKCTESASGTLRRNQGAAKSGGTSGEETMDDFRPSSMIDGGLLFRPVPHEQPHNIVIKINSQSKDTDFCPMMSPSAISSMSTGNPLDEASKGSSMIVFKPMKSNENSPKKKRLSIWKVLFVKEEKLSQRESVRTNEDFLSQDNALSQNGVLSQSQDIFVTSPTPEKSNVKLNENGVYEINDNSIKFRNPTKERLELRRKQSLSAPSMPFMEGESNSRKSSIIKSSIIQEEGNVISRKGDEPKLVRGGTLHGSRYIKKSPKTFNRANTVQERSPSSSNKFFDKLNDSFFVASSSKRLMTSTPTLTRDFKSNEDLPRSRMNTITKKIWDQKSKRFKQRQIRQRERTLRKKQAREKQLVNSSLVICIAFAVCILPTSLLHLYQVFSGIKTPGSLQMCINSIAWFHAIVNPFIYGYMNRFYRREYKKIMEEAKRKAIEIFTCSTTKSLK